MKYRRYHETHPDYVYLYHYLPKSLSMLDLARQIPKLPLTVYRRISILIRLIGLVQAILETHNEYK